MADDISFTDILKKIEDLEITIIRIKNSVDQVIQDFRKDIDVCNIAIYNNNLKAQEGFAKLDDFPNRVRSLEQSHSSTWQTQEREVKNVKDTIFAVLQAFNDICKRTDAQENMQGSLKKDQEFQDKRFNDLYSYVNVMDASLPSIRAKLSKEMSDAFTSIEKRINEKLEQPKEEPVDYQPVINRVRDDLTKKMELSIIDASNASLKAANAENALRMMEKKMENIVLTIRKLELAQ